LEQEVKVVKQRQGEVLESPWRRRRRRIFILRIKSAAGKRKKERSVN
jgi:hypothetical protein